MCVGEKRTLLVPPFLAYGAMGVPGVPSIPPGSYLLFRIELLKLENDENVFF